MKRCTIILLLLLPSLTWGQAVSSSTDGEGRGRSGTAFIKSLLLPGWGQLSGGERWKGYLFMGVEAAMAAGVIGYRSYGSWLEQDYKGFAVQHGAVRGGHPHQFYVDIGNWMDHTSYNEQRIRDRNFDALYTHPDDEWRWDSDANRRHFRSTRVASDRARQIALFIVGGMVINHLASAIDAARGPQRQMLYIQPAAGGEGVRVGVRLAISR